MELLYEFSYTASLKMFPEEIFERVLMILEAECEQQGWEEGWGFQHSARLLNNETQRWDFEIYGKYKK